jgi:transposase
MSDRIGGRQPVLTGENNMTAKDKGGPILADGRVVVGIDIGKRKHSATAVSPQGKIIAQLASFPNTREGVDLLEREVLRKAGGPAKTLIAMEATGHYWMCLYGELTARGYSCVVLNPIQTNARMGARIRKTRTDPVDSVGIARFILSGEARATRVPGEETVELRLLVRHRWRLVQARTDMERYAQTLLDRVFPEYDGIFSKPFLPSLRALIREIGSDPQQIASRQEEVRALLRRQSRQKISQETIDELLQKAACSIGLRQAASLISQQLGEIFEYLEFIERQVAKIDDQLESRILQNGSPLLSLGIGPALAASIHAESDPISDFRTPGQYVAYAGLDPSVKDSGDTVRGRSQLSKRGSPLLRCAYYQAAFVLYRRHDCFLRRYKRSRRNGRSHREALVIVADRLARVAWRLLTDNRPFKKRPPKKA